MKLRLTLDICYDNDEADPYDYGRELTSLLDAFVKVGASNRAFTGELPVTVDTWDYTIERIESSTET